MRLRRPPSRKKKKKTTSKNLFFDALKKNTRRPSIGLSSNEKKRDNYLFDTTKKQDTPVSFQPFRFDRDKNNFFDQEEMTAKFSEMKNSSIMMPIDIDCLSENQLMNLKQKIDSKLTVLSSSKGSSKRSIQRPTNPFLLSQKINTNIKDELIYRPKKKNKIIAKELDFMKESSRDTTTSNDIEHIHLKEKNARINSKLVYKPTKNLLMNVETPMESERERLSIGNLFMKKKRKKSSSSKNQKQHNTKVLSDNIEGVDKEVLKLQIEQLESEERYLGALDSNKTVRMINKKILEMENELNLLGKLKKI